MHWHHQMERIVITPTSIDKQFMSGLWARKQQDSVDSNYRWWIAVPKLPLFSAKKMKDLSLDDEYN